MTLEKRAYSFIPDIHKTKQNQREYYVLDDVMFEPEQADFLSGYIGSGDLLTEQDKKRTPLIRDADPKRNKYQLSIGTAHVDPTTGAYTRGAFFDDLVNQIAANGGIVEDQNRLFSVPYYTYNLPIDYDKHINYSRYYWTGEGSADVNGEYVTKSPKGSQSVIHQKVNNAWVRTLVRIVTSLPSSPDLGDMVERADDPNRPVFRWNGSNWLSVNFESEEGPDRCDINKYLEGDYVYFTRTGPDYQRPLLHRFSADAGRWIATPVVTSKLVPDFPRVGMVWEDTSVTPYRRLKRWDGHQWVRITWTPSEGPSGIPADGTYVYDTRNVVDIEDDWSRTNWWRHYEDLSPADREAVAMDGNADQAIRPIVEFWGDINTTSLFKIARNAQPKFRVYTYDPRFDDIENYSGLATTLFEFNRKATGTPDPVLGFPVEYSDTGEFMFTLTLESDAITDTNGDPIPGYRFFKDNATGLVHSIWAKSDHLLVQEKDEHGMYEVSRALTDNPNHEVFTDVSRSKILKHMASVIKSQNGFTGNEHGLNSYRYSPQDPDMGALLIDPESSLLRAMATVQDKTLNIPDAIRQTQKEYNRVLFKFTNKLGQLFTNLTLCDPTGTLTVTPAQAVDVILSSLFIGKNEDSPFHYADMGHYVETRKIGSTVVVIDETPKPIYIPSSAARIGSCPTWKPETFIDRDGTKYLRGHDGVTIVSFGDDRDRVWLELQNRFFGAVPDYRKTEAVNFSTRFDSANFFLDDYVGGFMPTATAPACDQIVDDYTAIANPAANLKVVSRQHLAYCAYTGDKWLTRSLLVDDIFKNNADHHYYIYNGFAVIKINSQSRNVEFDYTVNEFRQIIHREYERWAAYGGLSFANTDFDQNDRFTWNYRSAGVEGHYKGLYQRVYGTDTPHLHPWEILGYYIQPTWWTNIYPADSHVNGSPRWHASNAMWAAIQAGKVNNDGSRIVEAAAMAAPIPVDAQGELLDPISLGLVDGDKLDPITLNDDFVYGDGAPAEQAFRRSTAFPFAHTLAGFLMKPVRFVDALWSVFHTYVGVNGDNKVWHAPHVVHEGLLRRTRLGDIPMHLEVLPDGSRAKSVGLNAWIAEMLLQNGANPDTSFAKVIKNTTSCLGWRTAGFLNKARTIVETISGKEIPYEDVHVVIHQAPVTSEHFASGIVIAREDTGYRVYGYDSFRPYFECDMGVSPIVGGQVELREEIVATRDQHVFPVTKFNLPVGAADTARFTVMVDGQKIKPQHIKITSKSTFEIEEIVQIISGMKVVACFMTAQSNSSTRMKTFIINGRQFSYNASASGVLTRFDYGHYFDTPDEVINMMIGYARHLDTQGWKFELMDGNTGEINDWSLGAKKFAMWTTLNDDPRFAEAGYNPDLFYFSPMSTETKFVSEFGQILNIESIQNGAYGVIGPDAQPLTPEESYISRVEDTMTITAAGQNPIYGIRLYKSEIQHAVFLSNTTRFNDIVYNPVLSMWHETLRVDTYRTKNWTGRFEAPGFIIHGDALLPNFEKQAFDTTKHYDINNPVDDSDLRDQAWNLYGYTPKAYMEEVDADDRTKIKYHRGLSLTKGTRRPQQAFIRGTRLGTDNVFINEDWAWRVAEFGDTRAELVQFKVFKDDFTENKQVIMFQDDDVPGDNILQVTGLKRVANEDHPRWIIGPKKSSDGPANLRFPVGTTGPLVNEYKFFCQLINADTSTLVEKINHWDPKLGINEPGAMSLIDIVSYYDPAYYTDGVNPSPQGVSMWGEAQVGTLWWDQSRVRYSNYHNISDPLVKAREWGKQMYFRAECEYEDGVITVKTFDALTGAPAAHNLVTGDLVDIVDADQAFYNKTDLTVTVTGSNTFTWEIYDIPDTPFATGDVKVVTGKICVYEWIRSPVPPDQYELFVKNQTTLVYTGTPRMDGDDYSYSWVSKRNEYGKVVDTYYFWVRQNTAPNPKKDTNTRDVELRLDDPSTAGLPWFAPVDFKTMIIFTDGESVKDGYALEVLIDARVLTTHQEWVLISEDDQNNFPPEEIMEKLIDSMSGRNAQKDLVPSPFLSKAEQIGNMMLPAQTVFPDRQSAISVFITTANELLKETQFGIDTVLYNTFPLAYEITDTNQNLVTYWKRTDYRLTDYVDLPLTDTVATYQERDRRLTEGMYIVGDLVKVLRSEFKDAWEITKQVPATYVRTEFGWDVVGIDNWTAEIGGDDLQELQYFGEFRSLWEGLRQLFTPAQQNRLAFALLREMLRQNKSCSWFFKTSYMTVQIFSEIDSTPYTRPSEVDAILANINDTKPYRTKVRTQQATYSVAKGEAFDMDIEEIPDKKITIIFDRLSCNLIDDGGFDSFAWDMREFDLPIWTYPDLGRAKWDEIARFTGDSIRMEFAVIPHADARLYPRRWEILDENGVLVEPDTALIAVTMFVVEGSTLRIGLSYPLPLNYSLVIYQARGFVEGPAPSLGQSVLSVYPSLVAYQSDYEHAAVRAQKYAPADPCDIIGGCTDAGCNDPMGGNAEERVKYTMADSVLIAVTTSQTPLYAGFDTAPFDTTGFDKAPEDVGDRTFYISVGARPEYPPNEIAYPLYEDSPVDENGYAYRTRMDAYITAIQCNLGGTTWINLKEGEGWSHVVPTDQVIQVAEQYRVAGYAVRFIYTKWRLQAPLGRIEVKGASWEGELDTNWPTVVEVERFTMWLRDFDPVLHHTPPLNGHVSVFYTATRKGEHPIENFSRPATVVEEILDEHDIYDDAKGFEEDRPVGQMVISIYTQHLYRWDGTQWTDEGFLPLDQIIFERRTGSVYVYNGTSFAKVHTPGDANMGNWGIAWPARGEGLSAATYCFGTLAAAEVEWPGAFQIMQNPGDPR